MTLDKSLSLKSLEIIKSKIRDYTQLIKLRLTLLVVFSSLMGFLLASSLGINWVDFWVLMVSSFLIVGASNTINQILERGSDRLMSRTANRPLAEGRMEIREAVMASLIMGLIGVTLMGLFLNQLAALLAFIGLITYAFAYTPMKRISPVAVFIGGIAGAIPPLSGFVAVSGEITSFAIILFAIQFFWQFPHFWAIAWVMKEEYDKAGIRLLPLGSNKDRIGAIQIMMLTLVLIPLVLVPAKLGFISLWAAIICLIVTIGFFLQSVKLFYDLKNFSALQLMFGSFLYLPLILAVLFIDQLII